MSRDQVYGVMIFLVSLLIAIVYAAVFFGEYVGLGFLGVWKWWAVALPVILFVMAALAICMWIGWTMAATPPPEPFEELPPSTSSALEKENKE